MMIMNNELHKNTAQIHVLTDIKSVLIDSKVKNVNFNIKYKTISYLMIRKNRIFCKQF